MESLISSPVSSHLAPPRFRHITFFTQRVKDRHWVELKDKARYPEDGGLGVWSSAPENLRDSGTEEETKQKQNDIYHTKEIEPRRMSRDEIVNDSNGNGGSGGVVLSS